MILKEFRMKFVVSEILFLLAIFSIAATSSDAWIPKQSPWQNRECTAIRMGSSTAEIFGGGRIGSLLGKSEGSTVLGRGDSISADASGPILIATRNDSLEAIVDKCPENRRKDLVFLQNGTTEQTHKDVAAAWLKIRMMFSQCFVLLMLIGRLS